MNIKNNIQDEVLVEHWFTTEELKRETISFDKLSKTLANKEQCIHIQIDQSDWVIFARKPMLKDLSWLSYNFPKGFKVGQIKVESVDSFAHLLLLDNEHQKSEISIENRETEVISFVSQVLANAYDKGASDIHFENTVDGLIVKNRIDGVLILGESVKRKNYAEQVVSRLKILADLDISERRIPQDGRLTIHLGKQDIDLRVSIMPGLHGEDAVLRILDKQALTQEHEPLSLELLGFDQQSMIQIRHLAQQPYGMVLVTGPTGSGKTTTLYALLHEQHSEQQKLITIEDPVEYQIKGTLQIPVNERKGLTFAKGLRSILRHDPDTILVGEIRDRETAEIAVQAALTGHLVYSSVHANNALDVIGRFRHMEIDLFGFLNSLNGIIAQRLIRLNCSKCSVDIPFDDNALHEAGMIKDKGLFHLQKGNGCDYCQWTGYKGRKAIAEILIMTDELRELLLNGTPMSQIRKKLQQENMVFLRQQALAIVAQGQTTFQEINRVTFIER